MISQEQLDVYCQRAKNIKQEVINSTTAEVDLVIDLVLYPELVEELLAELQECLVKNEDETWRNYLLSIGVVNPNDEEEISRMLDKVERENTFYEANIIEALKEIELGESTYVTDIHAWLESLGD